MISVGINIGGTKTAVGLFADNRLLESAVIPTSDFESTMAGISVIAAPWLKEAKPSVVGVACAGPLDTVNGVVLNVDTLGEWHGKPISSLIGRAFSAPVTLVNDADAALMGEVFAGCNGLISSEPSVMLTFGTGVGGAAWDGQRILSGAFGEHPEIGHIGVDPQGPLCYCGVRGCLEVLTSGTAIDGFAKDIGFQGIESLAEEAEAGNEDALELLAKTNLMIGYALVTITHMVRPASIILGGGVMEKLHRYLAPDLIPVTPSTVPGPPPSIVLASLGNRAGMVGASVAARRRLIDH